MVRRPTPLPSRAPLSEAQIAQAHYVGSPEHKDRRWWGGLPEAWIGPDGSATRPRRQLTTICPLVSMADRDQATGWVRDALRRGQMRYYEADQTYPNHIWYRQDTGQIWFGRCVNSINGDHKGWPIDEEERREIFG
jgi:hypothetical protein